MKSRKQRYQTVMCVECGTLFQAARSHAKFCGARCRKIASRAVGGLYIPPARSRFNYNKLTLAGLESLLISTGVAAEVGGSGSDR